MDILEVRNISKSFPGVQALRNVSFSLKRGEIVGLVGENGAGKSTLIKILAGIYRPDCGDILLEGVPLRLHHPEEAKARGLAFVHQQLHLVPSFDAVDNVFLGQWSRSRKSMERRVVELCNDFGFCLKTTVPVRNLSTSEQWMVQILRAFLEKPRVLILDEPTAAFSQEEAATVLQVVRQIASQGVAVLYVSHRLSEVFALCSRLIVLRNGEKIWEGPTSAITPGDLIAKMAGEDRKERPQSVPPEPLGDTLLTVRELSDGKKLQKVSFSLSRGEVLCVYGLQGSGKTELLETIFGVRRKTQGEIFLRGKRFSPTSPKEALREGVALVPDRRGKKGLVLQHALFENIALPHLETYRGFWGYFQRKTFVPQAKEALSFFRTQYRDLSQPVCFLSGGNQQKVVLAKWFLKQFDLLLLDEPTTGVDVRSRRELYSFIWKLAQEGKGIVFTSGDLEEISEVAPHRVMVLREGAVQGIIPCAEATQRALLALCYGER
ncbi:MAG: sugar ABC transporter ATP-binding protein [Candidatus Caldatribacterium sp.]|uniref:sugar ABC transporter ATP-binding protein n=1 Tax=Candidatus Caldatribacterium sp. TaxID=2282143 RepID=UPI00299B907F|nr:sugar ABC transporter ATP-binding protein [Candidatus Caldatribacterium sp.]MCX7729848.1 sugar ABC transporter ATP-binding protein [Candidatus Caldatribacterium sp.]MDW8081287.1 sugar ABC transporter ATP-binding protein [Candidatus Calescibacterium sp.]